jgi:hypothetical protein
VVLSIIILYARHTSSGPFDILLYLIALLAIPYHYNCDYHFLRRFLYDRELVALKKKLEQEKSTSENLLCSIIPKSIVQVLKTRKSTQYLAREAKDATILFADLVQFTNMCSALPASEIVEILNKLFDLFDDLCVKHDVTKIKTIGDAYVVSGKAEYYLKLIFFKAMLLLKKQITWKL